LSSTGYQEYENSGRALVAAWAASSGATTIQMAQDPHARWDLIITWPHDEGGVWTEIIELKTRSYTSTKWDKWMAESAKIDALLQEQFEKGIDVASYYNVTSDNKLLIWNARDRDSPVQKTLPRATAERKGTRTKNITYYSTATLDQEITLQYTIT